MKRSHDDTDADDATDASRFSLGAESKEPPKEQGGSESDANNRGGRDDEDDGDKEEDDDSFVPDIVRAAEELIDRPIRGANLKLVNQFMNYRNKLDDYTREATMENKARMETYMCMTIHELWRVFNRVCGVSRDYCVSDKTGGPLRQENRICDLTDPNLWHTCLHPCPCSPMERVNMLRENHFFLNHALTEFRRLGTELRLQSSVRFLHNFCLAFDDIRQAYKTLLEDEAGESGLSEEDAAMFNAWASCPEDEILSDDENVPNEDASLSDDINSQSDDSVWRGV